MCILYVCSCLVCVWNNCTTHMWQQQGKATKAAAAAPSDKLLEQCPSLQQKLLATGESDCISECVFDCISQIPYTAFCGKGSEQCPSLQEPHSSPLGSDCFRVNQPFFSAFPWLFLRQLSLESAVLLLASLRQVHLHCNCRSTLCLRGAAMHCAVKLTKCFSCF